jgi:hypothetical protein
MPTIPQRIASAFAVFCGRYGDVTKMAEDRERSRQALYREAEQVANAVDGATAQAQIDDLQRQLGVDPTVVSQGAIWNIEAAEASPKAVRCESRKFCDLDTTLGFLGVSMSRNSDAKPLTCATYFATSGPRR